MSGLSRALVALAVAGLVLGLAALALVTTSDREDVPGPSVVVALTLGWAFIGAGLYAWWRRPENRIGALMTMVGFVWFLGALDQRRERVGVHARPGAELAVDRRARAHAGGVPDRPGGPGARAQPRAARVDRRGGPGAALAARLRGPRLRRLPGQPAAGVVERHRGHGARGDRHARAGRRPRRSRRRAGTPLALVRPRPAAGAQPGSLDRHRGRRRRPADRGDAAASPPTT